MSTPTKNIGLLPTSSILKKLNDHSPGAANDVMTRMESLQKQVLAKRKKQISLRAIFDIFSPLEKTELQSSCKNRIQESWENVGHYMRQAMRDYIADNNIDITTLKLTPEELTDLAALSTKQLVPRKQNRFSL